MRLRVPTRSPESGRISGRVETGLGTSAALTLSRHFMDFRISSSVCVCWDLRLLASKI